MKIKTKNKTKKSVLYTTMIMLGIMGILLISPSVMSQSIINNSGITSILSSKASLVAYVSGGVICFIWGVGSKWMR